MPTHEDYVPTPKERVPANGVVIEFSEDNKRAAGNSAQGLKEALENALSDSGEKASVKLEKIDPNAQDIGTILGIVLAGPAVVAIAKGIADWMRRTGQGSITIVRPDGTRVEITNIASADIPKTTAALSG